MKLKTNWHFAKWDGLNLLSFILQIRCFKNLWGSANVLWQIPLKMWKKWRKCWVQHIFWSSKLLFCFWIKVYFLLKNSNFVSKLSNVVQFYVEKRNVVSTLFNAVNFNVDLHNVALMLIWRCATSRRHINLKTMLNRRWNVCWVNFMVNTLKITQLEQHLQSYNSMIIYIHGLKQFECVLQKKLIANLRKSISISVLLSKIELYQDIIVS